MLTKKHMFRLTDNDEKKRTGVNAFALLFLHRRKII